MTKLINNWLRLVMNALVRLIIKAVYNLIECRFTELIWVQLVLGRPRGVVPSRIDLAEKFMDLLHRGKFGKKDFKNTDRVSMKLRLTGIQQ
jgi:hypothetical protein